MGDGMSQSLTDRYDDRIAGVLSCYDRVVVTGTLPGVCYADGMTRYLNARGIRIFDYPEFAKPLRDRVRDCAATLAAEAGLTIEHIGKSNIRKEEVVARVLKQRVIVPGWSTSSQPWKPVMPISLGTTSGRTKPSSGRIAASACTITSTSWMPGSG